MFTVILGLVPGAIIVEPSVDLYLVLSASMALDQQNIDVKHEPTNLTRAKTIFLPLNYQKKAIFPKKFSACDRICQGYMRDRKDYLLYKFNKIGKI